MAVTGFASGIKNIDECLFHDGPMAASASIYRMAIVMRDASGNLKNGATATGCHGVGVGGFNDVAGSDSNVWDNSAGNAGDIRAKYHEGVYGPFANSGSSIAAGDEGKVCYIVDNVTVHGTDGSGTRSPAGTVYAVTTDGVYVEFDEDDVRAAAASAKAKALGALAALTDNSGGAAADGTIGAVTLPTLAGWNGGTDPTAAEATQIITACTALRDAVKELATKVNAMIAAATVA